MSDTIYAPGTTIKTKTTSFGDILKLSIHVEKLAPFLKEHANERGWVNFDIVPRKEEGQYGETHSIKLDTWKPKQQGEGGGGQAPARKPAQKPAGAAKPKTKDPLDQGYNPDAAPDDVPF